MWRLNYGNGQVSEVYARRVQAQQVLLAQRTYSGRIGQSCRAFVEFRDPDTFEWFPSKAVT